MVGLVLGGLVLLLLLIGGAVLLASNSDDSDVAAVDDTTIPSGRELTTVPATGPVTDIDTSDITRFVQREQEKVTPDLTVGEISCPPGPYRVSQVMVCSVLLDDTNVLYRVEVTGPRSLKMEPTKPILDTDKAEALMESRDPGSTADCGSPRVRQLDVGDQLTCRSDASTWDFTVTPDGDLSGTPR